MLADSFGSEAEARFNAGEFEQSLECSQQALEITEKIENLWGQSYDRMLMAFVYLEVGQFGTRHSTGRSRAFNSPMMQG